MANSSPTDPDSDDDNIPDGDDEDPTDEEDGIPEIGFFDRPLYVVNVNMFGQHFFFSGVGGGYLTTDDEFLLGFSQFSPVPINPNSPPDTPTIYNDNFNSFKRAGTQDAVTLITNDTTAVNVDVHWNQSFQVPADPRDLHMLARVDNSSPEWFLPNVDGYLAPEGQQETTGEVSPGLFADTFTGTNETNSGTVWWTHVDLDIDSDNDNGFLAMDRSVAEEDLEESDDPANPGAKIIVPNTDDDDGDDTRDDMDLEIEGENDLIPIVLDIAPVTLPWDMVYIKFIAEKADETPETNLRLWRAPNPGAERQATDEIAFDQVFPAADLGFSATGSLAKYYIEALGEEESLNVKIKCQFIFSSSGVPAAGAPFFEDTVLVSIVPIEFVRLASGSGFERLENIPVVNPGTGVGRGELLSAGTVPDFFTITRATPLDSGVVDTMDFELFGSPATTLTETGVSTNTFSGSGVIIEVLSPITFEAALLDRFQVTYSNSSTGVSNQLRVMTETVDAGVFRTIDFPLTVTLAAPPSPSVVDTLTFEGRQTELPLVISGTLTETTPASLVFTDGTTTVVLDLGAGLSPAIIDSVVATVTSAPLAAIGIPVALPETGSSSLVFTGFDFTSGTETDLSPVSLSSAVEIFRIRAFSDTPDATISYDVVTEVETKTVTLDRVSGNEFISGDILALAEGANTGAIPNPGDFTLIQVRASDTDRTTSEITIKKVGEQDIIFYGNAIRPAFVGQSFIKAENLTLWQAGKNMVDLWVPGVRDDLGYPLYQSSGEYSCTKTEFLNGSRNSQFFAWFGHGLYNKAGTKFIGLVVQWDPVGMDVELKPSEIDNGLDYEFVFLNGCGSATPGNAAAADFVKKFNSRIYLGWSQECAIGLAGSFQTKFVEEINREPITRAVSQSISRIDGVVFMVAAMANGKATLRKIWRSDMTATDQANFSVDLKP